ncbi:O-acetyl-ADP-ribose deacetylase [Demequina sp. NBRC 110056]|uniref:O-acetyl-ADP-ribose deacetylase n=1 Tax=Demequina sp. NBRC 110056 TaxID=1570345 RepID=UPI000A05083B|nr:O-acetyl-ADP-ribose deacetylase [Demequina sp. NBRC 110056]
MTHLRALKADITTLDVDAIVNAANETLLGGSGVDGAIHAAAGRGLYEECRELGGCEPGEAKMTGGHRLPATHVIHTVGPIWRGGGHGERDTLASCYSESIALAAGHGLGTVAFPCIATGTYGFPRDFAADIAIETVRATAAEHRTIREVIFCCFSDYDLELYEARLD